MILNYTKRELENQSRTEFPRFSETSMDKIDLTDPKIKRSLLKFSMQAWIDTILKEPIEFDPILDYETLVALSFDEEVLKSIQGLDKFSELLMESLLAMEEYEKCNNLKKIIEKINGQ